MLAGVLFATTTQIDLQAQPVEDAALLYYKINRSALTAIGDAQTLDFCKTPAPRLRVGNRVEIEAPFARTGSAPMLFDISFGGFAMQSVAIPRSVRSATCASLTRQDPGTLSSCFMKGTR